MNMIQRLDLLAPANVLSIPGLVAVWDGSDPRNGGVGLADGDGITILENTADPRPAFYEPFTTALREGWTNVQGTLAITGGLGYFSSDADADMAVRDSGIADGVFSVTVSGDLTGAVDYRALRRVFRYLDANNFLVADLYDGNARLRKMDGGVESSLATGATTTSDATNYRLKVSCNGNSVQVFKDGTSLFTHTLAGGDTKYALYTSEGLRLQKGGTPTSDARADDLVTAKLTDAVQTTAASKPTFKTAILNGLAIGRFDGGDMLNCADVLDSVFAGASAKYTVYFIARSTTAAAQTVIGKFHAAAGERGVTFGFRDNGAALHLDSASVDRGGTNYLVQRGGTDVLNTFTIASMTFDATEATNVNRQKIYRNGSTETLTAVLSGTGIAEDNATLLTIGATAAGAAYLTGDVAVILLCNGLHTTMQRRRVERLLSRKWGLSLTA